MKAYNPVTGAAFREAWVERDRRQQARRIIEMPTGRRFPFERQVVLELVAGEADLSRALRQTPDNAENDAKLLRAIKIYNQRYPFDLPVEEPNR